MLTVGKPVSLVQQKKQQWAREREEMSHLYLPWASGDRYNHRLQVRNQFASTLELHKQSSYEYQEPIQRQRSPSLPPIHNIEPAIREEARRKDTLNRNIPSAKRFAFYDEDGEGDTSGYGSETINHKNNRRNSGALHDMTNGRDSVIAWQQDHIERNQLDTMRSTDGAWSGRSPRSNDEGRPRWGDRGVATGRLWEPTAPSSRLPQMQNQKKGTPSWVERGLNMIENSADVHLIDQRSSDNSALDCDRLSCNGSDEGRTYLRGQNVPLEPEVKAQRESKRIKALELQSAILSQLEEQEKKKQEERQRKLREERLEEIRVQRQQEEEKLRLEHEKRRNEEKQLLEERRLDALKKALEEAEKKAKQDKEKRFTSHRPPKPTFNKEEQIVTAEATESNERTQSIDPASPTKTNRTYDVHSSTQNKVYNSQQSTEFNSPRSTGQGNLNLFIHSVPPLALTDNQFKIVPIGVNTNGEVITGQSNNIQLAVLVPQNLQNNNLYSLTLNNNYDSSDTGKIITPRKYRIPITKDASTQTEVNRSEKTNIKEKDEVERNIDKDYPNIDENAPQDSHYNTLKKDRRFRSDDRFKKDLESRPKWGVNRPAAQYKKQSEKDPFYSQKRKVRQKYRPQARQYLSQSSEDSRSPSPPNRTEKVLESSSMNRNSISQTYWKNKRPSQDLSKNSNTDPIIEFKSLGHIAVNDIAENKKSPKMSPTKRITLSQKFINDKYGNRKLWLDDLNDRHIKSHSIDSENRKKIIDQLNFAKRELMDRNEGPEHFDTKTKL